MRSARTSASSKARGRASIRSPAGPEFDRLRAAGDPAIFDHLAPVFETVRRLRAELPPETTLLGFCGAPWTVASYMIGGRGTPDLAPARALAESDPALVDALIDRLVAVQTAYLVRQLRAGADAVQIFESHAGTLPAVPGGPDAVVDAVGEVADSALPQEPEDALSRWSFRPIARMIAGIRKAVPDARIIVFCRGAGLDGHARVVPETGADAVGVDWSVDLKALRDRVPATTVTQGNLHPDTLIAGGRGARCRRRRGARRHPRPAAYLQPRPRHHAADAGGACRADAGAAPGRPAGLISFPRRGREDPRFPRPIPEHAACPKTSISGSRPSTSSR